MVESVFVEELKGKGRKKVEEAKDKTKETFEIYEDFTRWNNLLISIICVVFGSISFLYMGYVLQNKVKNYGFFFGSFMEVMLVGILVMIGLWALKSFVAYSIWQGALRRDGDRSVFFPFFVVEGMSEIAYVIALPIFIVFSFFMSSYILSLVIGGAVFLKLYLMYVTYPSLLPHCSRIDRVILLISSFATLMVIRAAYSLICL